MSQVEPIPSGNLPPGFDANACRSVYVGNIHPLVTDALLAEVFGSVGPLESCKLIRKEKTSFGFIDYYDHASAASALASLNGRPILGQAIKVNWAYASGQREDTSNHYSIFVGDLSPEITDAILYAAFSIYHSCSDARVMWDQRSGRSRGFGFVSFRNQQEAESAIAEMTGKWLGSRQMRCNWAAKNTATAQEEARSYSQAYSQTQSLTQSMQPDPSQAADGNTDGTDHMKAQMDVSQVGSQYTTVYVGNLSTEVSQAELHRQFFSLGIGTIEEVRMQKDKGFGFIRYRTHEEAAMAIQAANGRVIGGKSIKCSWGSKPTVPGSGIPNQQQVGMTPPMAAYNAAYNPAMAAAMNSSAYGAADMMAYQQQMAMAQAALYPHQQAQMQAQSMQPQAMPPQQIGPNGSAMGMSPAGGVYDGYPQYGVPSMQTYNQQQQQQQQQQQNVYQ